MRKPETLCETYGPGPPRNSGRLGAVWASVVFISLYILSFGNFMRVHIYEPMLFCIVLFSCLCTARPVQSAILHCGECMQDVGKPRTRMGRACAGARRCTGGSVHAYTSSTATFAGRANLPYCQGHAHGPNLGPGPLPQLPQAILTLTRRCCLHIWRRTRFGGLTKFKLNNGNKGLLTAV